MKFSKLLPHLVGAIAIINAPAMVSPVSKAEIERMKSTTQELKRLRDYPNIMSPSELATWRSQAAAWIDSWIAFLESIDLQSIANSLDSDLAFLGTANLRVIDRLKEEKAIRAFSAHRPDEAVLFTAYIMRDSVHYFDTSIVPIGMNIENISETFSEGMKLSIKGIYHSFSVNQYYFDNYGPPIW